MSLLKGIVFIPRTKQVESIKTTSDRNGGKKRKVKDHKSKKSSGRKKNRKDDRINPPLTMKDDLGGSSSSDDSDNNDDDDGDFKDFRRYENEMISMQNSASELPPSGEMRDSRTSSPRLGNTNLNRCSQLRQKSSFSTLIGSLKSEPPNANHMNNSAYEHDALDSDVEFNRGKSYQGEHCRDTSKLDIHETVREHNAEIPKVESITANVASNQSVAALFRKKLKDKVSQSEIRSLSQIIEDDERDIEHAIVSENEKLTRDKALKKLVNDNSHDRSIELAKKGVRSTSRDHTSNNLGINQLMKSEKLDGKNMDDIFRDNVLRLGSRYKGTELGTSGAFGNGNMTGADEEEDIDMKLFENKHENDEGKRSKKQTLKSIGSENRKQPPCENEKRTEKEREVLRRCPHCTESAAYKPYLTVSTAQHTMLRLKAGQHSLVSGHCVIVPHSHSSSFLKCEEEVDLEISRYKSCLRRMYERNGQAVLFLESALEFGRHPHACIDVVPVPSGIEGEARMCFREVSCRLLSYHHSPLQC